MLVIAKYIYKWYSKYIHTAENWYILCLEDYIKS